MDQWYIPITILPGICLLILSTSNLLIGLNQEIHLLFKETANLSLLDKKIRQLERLSQAMVLFYCSCALMVLSGILIAFESKVGSIDFGFIGMLTGILLTLVGLLYLIRYAVYAVTIRKNQHRSTLEELGQ